MFSNEDYAKVRRSLQAYKRQLEPVRISKCIHKSVSNSNFKTIL